MSGAEGIAGLAVGAVGLAALFTTCIDAFNIVVTAREFGHDYDVLCADLALQRLRFCLWGEAVGLVSRVSLQPQVRLSGLDNPQIISTLTQTLQAIQSLLKSTERTRDRFSLRPNPSRELGLFRGTYNQVRLQTYVVKRPNSVVAATKWAVYTGDKFRERIDRLKSLIDGLKEVSETLGVRDIQESRMRTEIASLDDVESLRLIEEVSSQSQRELSEIASQRLFCIETSSAMEQASALNNSQTFYTAEESQHRRRDQTRLSDSESQEENFDLSMTELSVPQNSRIVASCIESTSRSRCWKAGPKTDAYGAKLHGFDLGKMAGSGHFPTGLLWLREMLQSSPDMEITRYQDTRSSDWAIPHHWREWENPRRLVAEFGKFQTFRNAEYPWIAFAPIQDEMNHLLAAIEGPPDTPYEGGVFWLEICIPPSYPFRPPHCRFLTRVYHPNINSRGQICLDILSDQWAPFFTIRHVLVSILSIFDDPGLTDPLVPEIAEIYCRDYDTYHQNAEAYTMRYATAGLRDKEWADRALRHLALEPSSKRIAQAGPKWGCPGRISGEWLNGDSY